MKERFTNIYNKLNWIEFNRDASSQILDKNYLTEVFIHCPAVVSTHLITNICILWRKIWQMSNSDMTLSLRTAAQVKIRGLSFSGGGFIRSISQPNITSEARVTDDTVTQSHVRVILIDSSLHEPSPTPAHSWSSLHFVPAFRWINLEPLHGRHKCQAALKKTPSPSDPAAMERLNFFLSNVANS